MKHETPAQAAKRVLQCTGYATGGAVSRARGGATGKKPSTTVNVIVASGGGAGKDEHALRGSMQRGMHASPMGAPPAMPGMGGPLPPGGAMPPSIGPMALGGPPLGAPPMAGMKPPGMGLKRGGKVKGYVRRKAGGQV